MFILEHGREHLWQWDSNQRVMVEDNTISQVHFCNRTTPNSLVVETYIEDGELFANIPNILLQDNWDICVYAYCDCFTKVEERLKVKARSKPSDYVYTETEIVNYQTLLDKMNTIEENIGKAVEDYLIDNPIEAGATDEQVAQINRNTSDIADIEIELSELPTKDYVDNAVQNVQVDLTEYATKKYVDEEDQSIIDSMRTFCVSYEALDRKLANYATEQYVTDAIAEVAVGDLSIELEDDGEGNVTLVGSTLTDGEEVQY